MTKRSRNVIVCTIFFSACLSVYVLGIIDKNLIHKNHILTVGQAVNAYYKGGRGGPMNYVDYVFWVGGKRISGTSSFTTRYYSLHFCRQLVGHNFPVEYYPPRPSVSDLLVVPGEFEFYKIPYPDSLKWVTEIMYK